MAPPSLHLQIFRTLFALVWNDVIGDLVAFSEVKSDRGTKSKPIPGPHLVYGFLTTEPNAVVAPIHPKAMPVIRRRKRSATSGCAHRGMRQGTTAAAA
jgi:hypothetical protein